MYVIGIYIYLKRKNIMLRLGYPFRHWMVENFWYYSI